MKSNTHFPQVLLLCGAFGYALCLAADFILDLLPGGILTSGAMSDFAALAAVIADAPPSRFALSGILGVLSMVFIALGMVGIFEYARRFLPRVSCLILASGIGSAVLGAVYHIICTTCAWLFTTLGCTQEAFGLYRSYMAAHSLLLGLNSALYTVMATTLFLAIILKKLPLPRWTCVFNVVLIYFVLSFFNVPGATSIGGLVMCLALALFSWGKNGSEPILQEI